MAASDSPSSPAPTKDSRSSRSKSRSGHKPELMVLTPQQSHTLSTSTSFSSTTSESTPATASTSATTTAAATPTAASQLSTPGPSTPHQPLRGARSGTRISSSPDPSATVAIGASLPSASLAPAGGLGVATTAAGAQFHQGTTSYGSHHPPPLRPYTPATPSTPTAMQLTIPPLTPPYTAALTSPRLEAHHHHHHHHHHSAGSGGKSPGLFPFGGTTPRVGSISGSSGGTGGATTRRMPSSESSLYDPYRARQPGVSANRVKNEYQAQSPIRENYAVFSSQHPTTAYANTQGSSSEEDLHNHQHGHHKESLTEEQVFGMMIMHPPPSIGQREDYYRYSPTLTASQTLAATYGNASTTGGSRPESPFQSSPYLPYQSYQPYSNQLSLPSPLIMDSNYGLPSPMALASPGLSPFHYGGHEELRSSEHKADPYRSAYSAARDTGSSVGAQGYGSPYLNSGGAGAGPQGSPNMNEDFSSSFESRFSSLSRGGGSSANNSRYPLHVLAGQDSNQALSTAYYEHQHVHLQQQLQKQQQKAAASAAAKAATSPGKSSGSEGKGGEVGTSPGKGSSDHIRQSQQPSQPSKTDSSGTKKAKTEMDEDEENDVILQKLGVISVDSSGSRSGGTRSGLTQGSGRSRRKGQWTDESEEESQERGRPRQRRSMSARRRGRGGRSEDRVQCCCCSRKVCIWLSMGLLACLAVSLYFLIPRAPQFSFDSVASQSAPVVTKSRIKEQFQIQLIVDSTSNYLSLRIDRMDVSVTLKSLQDGAKIADNDDLDSAFIISPKTTEMVSLPMRLDYRTAAPPTVSATAMNSTGSASYVNSTDVVYQQLVKACTPINVDNTTDSSMLSASASSSSLKASAAPGLNVVIHGQMHVWGLSWIWKPSFDISVMNLPCPINAPSRNPVSELPPGPPVPTSPPSSSPSKAV
ncbi:hypothetical protein EMPS_11488 [Entomortierella parvispora]|uniref:Uncharacterized protein n=1 Tax=Entomortierella parvispora TaxID=205924 RepID=A0A9P3HLU5_9FUNG|nr:hypothetical protein EMPS_11488 [Entomortierella parvispora]